MKYISFIIMLFMSSSLFSQDLFEQDEESSEKPESIFELNGYLRGTYFCGKVQGREVYDTKSAYGEAALKLRVSKGEFGNAYAEIRYLNGFEFGYETSRFNLREAYVDTYLGPVDLRIGKQIIVWGRADGFNPTNNITPQNMLTRSPDDDDKREGNFMIKSSINFTPLKIETIWIPVYKSSVIPTNFIKLPKEIVFGNTVNPDYRLDNGSYALKFNFEFASFDGSISYFNGYNPYPGIDTSAIFIVQGMQYLNMATKPYRLNIIGADFSTTIGSLFGMRGEFAYREPIEDYNDYVFIPNPDYQYVIGFDKEINDFSIIMQYIGRYVADYKDLKYPKDLSEIMGYLLDSTNRKINFQLNELTHSVSFRPAQKLMHETLVIEFPGMYNFTTEEIMLRPKISYDITDALKVSFGGEFYNGPRNSIYSIINPYLSSIFFELKSSF